MRALDLAERLSVAADKCSRVQFAFLPGGQTSRVNGRYYKKNVVAVAPHCKRNWMEWGPGSPSYSGVETLLSDGVFREVQHHEQTVAVWSYAPVNTSFAAGVREQNAFGK